MRFSVDARGRACPCPHGDRASNIPPAFAPWTLAGAGVNTTSDLGFTPLEAAAAGKHADVVRLLLAHGAADLEPSRPTTARAFVDALKAGTRPATLGTSAARVPTGPVHPTSTAAAAADRMRSSGSRTSSTSVAAPAPNSTSSIHPSSPGPSTSTAVDAAAVPPSSDVSAAPGALSLAPAPPPPAAKLCAHCGAAKSATVKLSKCSLCQAVRYCSAACQAAHWRAGGHRRACKALREGAAVGLGKGGWARSCPEIVVRHLPVDLSSSWAWFGIQDLTAGSKGLRV